MFAFTALVGPVTPVASTTNNGAIVQDARAIESIKQNQKVSNDQSISAEMYIRSTYKDTPILIEVARCESEFRHVNQNGTILRGVANPDDVGVMQINEYYHESRAEKEGLNLYSIEGNVQYAKELYDREGTRPWSASKPCWSKSEAYANLIALSK